MEAKKARDHGSPAPPPARAESDRRFYKIGEVCEMTDTQPYVLRFWESEFPQLAPRKSRAGQRIYQKQDVDMILRIRKLLYDEEYTIAGARKKLEEEGLAAPPAPAEPRKSARAETAPEATATAAADRDLLATMRALRKELRGLKDLLDRR